MPFDYSAIAAIAAAQVADKGRAITLRRLDSTPSDPSKPWRESADPRATPSATLATFGVFVEPSSLQTLGLNIESLDWLPRAQQVAIIATGADLEPYAAGGELIDVGTVLWRIVGVSTLRPGNDRLVHFVGVAR